ncbi:MAG: FecCD family ABC transporter permease, partial [Marinobacter sp.]
LVGSLTGRDWTHLGLVWPWLAVGLPVAMALARSLNLLQLGDEIAQGLGLAVFRTRVLLMLVAIALTASVVAVCGPIGFVALIAPHMVRGLLRTTDARQVLPISALLGALLLTVSDLLARELFSPTELPVGLVTVALGSPVALFLLRRLMEAKV